MVFTSTRNRELPHLATAFSKAGSGPKVRVGGLAVRDADGKLKRVEGSKNFVVSLVPKAFQPAIFQVRLLTDEQKARVRAMKQSDEMEPQASTLKQITQTLVLFDC